MLTSRSGLQVSYPKSLVRRSAPTMLLTLNRYLRIGVLLHVMTLAEVALILAITIQFDIVSWVSAGDTPLRLLALYPLWSPPIFAQLDARSRYQNYKQVKDQFQRFGYRPLIVVPVLSSRCQRDAVLVAAHEEGCGNECREFFHSHGYRWYHVLPDVMFKRPWYLLHPRFVRTTFFAPMYRPKTAETPYVVSPQSREYCYPASIRKSL